MQACRPTTFGMPCELPISQEGVELPKSGGPGIVGWFFPIASMHGIFTYIWSIVMVNVSKYTIHGWYGNDFLCTVYRGSSVPGNSGSPNL